MCRVERGQRRTKQLRQGLVGAADDAALDRDADQQRDHTLGHRAEGVERVRAGPGEITLRDQVPMANDGDAAKTGDGGTVAQRRIETTGIDLLPIG